MQAKVLCVSKREISLMANGKKILLFPGSIEASRKLLIKKGIDLIEDSHHLDASKVDRWIFKIIKELADQRIGRSA